MMQQSGRVEICCWFEIQALAPSRRKCTVGEKWQEEIRREEKKGKQLCKRERARESVELGLAMAGWPHQLCKNIRRMAQSCAGDSLEAPPRVLYWHFQYVTTYVQGNTYMYLLKYIYVFRIVYDYNGGFDLPRAW